MIDNQSTKCWLLNQAPNAHSFLLGAILTLQFKLWE